MYSTIFYWRKIFQNHSQKIILASKCENFRNSLNDCVFRKISAIFSKIIFSFSLLVFSRVECHHAYLNSIYIQSLLSDLLTCRYFISLNDSSDAAWYYSQFYLWSFVFAHCIYGTGCREEISAVSHKNSLVDWYNEEKPKTKVEKKWITRQMHIVLNSANRTISAVCYSFHLIALNDCLSWLFFVFASYT